MLDDLRAYQPPPSGAAWGLPPEAPLPMPKQVIERRRARVGWLRRLLGAAG